MPGKLIGCPQTKDIKEGFLSTAFDLHQADQEVKQVVDFVEKNVEVLSQKIARRKYRVKKQCLSLNSFNGIILQCHQHFRNILKTNLSLYKEIMLHIEYDKAKVTEQLRKISLMRAIEKKEFETIQYRYKLAKEESEKVVNRLQTFTKRDWIRRLDENFKYEGQAQQSDGQLQILQTLTDAVSEQVERVNKEQGEIRMMLDSFWTSKPEQMATTCNQMMNLFDSIVKTRPYQERLERMKLKSNLQPRSEEMSDLKYEESPGDMFDPKNIEGCGVDLKYTRLEDDVELFEENPYYEYPEDLEKLDEKLEQNMSEGCASNKQQGMYRNNDDSFI